MTLSTRNPWHARPMNQPASIGECFATSPHQCGVIVVVEKIVVYDNNPVTLMGARGEALLDINGLARGTRVPRIRVLSVT